MTKYFHEISLWLLIAVIITSAFVIDLLFGAITALVMVNWVGHVMDRGAVEGENEISQ